MTTAKACDSCRWPGVTQTAKTVPWPSVTRWTLVPKPPCERPSAWSCGSCSCSPSGPPSAGGGSGFFFRPGGGAGSPNDGGIDQPQVTVDEALLVQPQQEGVEDLGPGAVLAPAVAAGVDRLRRAVAVGDVRPGGAGVQAPQDAVDDGAVVFPRVPRPAAVVAVGEEGGDELPLGVGEFVAVHGWPPLGNRPAGQLEPLSL